MLPLLLVFFMCLAQHATTHTVHPETWRNAAELYGTRLEQTTQTSKTSWLDKVASWLAKQKNSDTPTEHQKFGDAIKYGN